MFKPLRLGVVVFLAILSGCQTKQNINEAWEQVKTDAQQAYQDSKEWFNEVYADAFSEDDKKEIRKEGKTVLETNVDGEGKEWTSEQTGATVTMTPLNTRVEQKTYDLIFAENVQFPKDIQFLGALYTVTQNTNVRTSPKTTGRVTAWLREGDVFRAVGAVQDEEWILVERYGVIIGYVNKSLVVTTDENNADIGAAEGKTVTQKISGNTTCRTLEVEVVSKEGAREKKNANVCFRPDGEWGF
ncbi:SH3 domain-containing protein [Curvivirga aplysinae]|uniref:SH3 domain-containing protein n=1 Tax=Curvivirga aplysinae TaxID=2529852 RepID=UPI0012BD7F73|nr:SH3 domain-containing protein [Curvivirga aplysinae]MTI10163.1 SH3 domain-containing protein [Curvivirga aplysinae]